jgi:hypothetical protein
MADINLTQVEADNLIAMEKQRVNDRDWLFPSPGDRVAIALTSLDKMIRQKHLWVSSGSGSLPSE